MNNLNDLFSAFFYRNKIILVCAVVFIFISIAVIGENNNQKKSRNYLSDYEFSSDQNEIVDYYKKYIKITSKIEWVDNGENDAGDKMTPSQICRGVIENSGPRILYHIGIKIREESGLDGPDIVADFFRMPEKNGKIINKNNSDWLKSAGVVLLKPLGPNESVEFVSSVPVLAPNSKLGVPGNIIRAGWIGKWTIEVNDIRIQPEMGSSEIKIIKGGFIQGNEDLKLNKYNGSIRGASVKDEYLESAKLAASDVLKRNAGQLGKIEIISSVARRQSSEYKLEASRRNAGPASEADVIVIIEFKISGMRNLATIGCIKNIDSNDWLVSIIDTTLGH